ncbi:MAG TPA: DUF5985 family protein [Terriglobales bacterium]|nr:DUF5985 family protein [Terriglobales bacterium]
MAGLVYVLCAATSALCFYLLFRAYKVNRHSLLFWSAMCFACLAANNALLVIDRVVLPESIDLSTVRLFPALAAMAVLLYGLVWHTE